MKVLMFSTFLFFAFGAQADKAYQESSVKGLWHPGNRFERTTKFIYVTESLAVYACKRFVFLNYPTPVRCKASDQLVYDVANDRMSLVGKSGQYLRVHPDWPEELYLGEVPSYKIILGQKILEDVGVIQFLD